MSSMRVAVTGGSGRIGSQVVKLLVERGYTVLNLDRRQAREPHARFVYVDLSKREQVHPILETVEAVCHLGEIPSPDSPGYGPEEVYALNTRIGSVVMQTAADLKLKRVVYTSTCQVYGIWGPDSQGGVPVRLPFDETLPLQPRNVYSLSKASNESYARLLSAKTGLSIAMFRFPAVWGWNDEDLKRWKPKWKPEDPLGDGMSTYLHTEDAAQAFLLALENPRPGCEAYHFTAAEVLGAGAIRERLKKHHPQYPELPADWPELKSPALLDKAKEHLGWTPKRCLRSDLVRLELPPA